MSTLRKLQPNKHLGISGRFYQEIYKFFNRSFLHEYPKMADNSFLLISLLSRSLVDGPRIKELES